MRIDGQKAAQHTARMDTEIDYDVMDEAERLAIEAFGRHAEREHIEAVYERLLVLRQWGLPAAGAATVH